MKIRRILRKALGEERKEKYQTTDKSLRVQTEEGKRRGRQKTTNPAVKTGRQGGIPKKTINITKARPRKGLNLKAGAKAKRNQRAEKGTLSTIDMKTRE